MDTPFETIVIDDSTDDETQSLPASNNDYDAVTVMRLNVLAQSFGCTSNAEIEKTFPYHKYGVPRYFRVPHQRIKMFEKMHVIRTHDAFVSLTIKVDRVYSATSDQTDTYTTVTREVVRITPIYTDSDDESVSGSDAG
jgi:hypothetical protein